MSNDRRAGLGRRLYESRERRGMSLSDLARTADVDKSTITRLESGQNEPRVFTMDRIARALGVSLDWLVAGRGGAA